LSRYFSRCSSWSSFHAYKTIRQALEKARSQLGPAAFEAAQAEGQQMSLEQALMLATENEDAPLSKAGLVPRSA
jgi:hypothetical protein